MFTIRHFEVLGSRVTTLRVMAWLVWLVISIDAFAADLNLLWVDMRGGHRSVSLAVMDEIENEPGVQLQEKSWDDLVSDRVREKRIEPYFEELRRRPYLWQLQFSALGLLPPSLSMGILADSFIDEQTEERFVSALAGKDAMVSFHPFPLIVAEVLQQRRKISPHIRFVNVLTDLTFHSTQDTRGLVISVSRQQTERLEARRDARSVHFVEGIPARKRVSDVPEKRWALGLEEGIPLVVIIGGSGGYAMDRVVDFLPDWAPNEEVQVVLLTGRNSDLYLRAMETSSYLHPNLRLRVRGYTEDLYRYLLLSDVVVTKPGGATIGELAAMRKGFLTLDTLPGQERGNFGILRESNAAVRIQLEDLNRVSFLQARMDISTEGMVKLFPHTGFAAVRAKNAILNYLLADEPVVDGSHACTNALTRLIAKLSG